MKKCGKMPLFSRLQAPGCRLFYSVHGESALVSVVCVCVENVACEEVRLRVTEEPKGNSGVHCLNQVLKVCPWLKQSINIKVTHKTERLSNKQRRKNRKVTEGKVPPYFPAEGEDVRITPHSCLCAAYEVTACSQLA